MIIDYSYLTTKFWLGSSKWNTPLGAIFILKDLTSIFYNISIVNYHQLITCLLVGGSCASLVGQTIIVPFDVISQHLMLLGQMSKQVRIRCL